MGQLEDMLLGVNTTMRHTNALLAHLYKLMQQTEADKVPHDEKLWTVNVVCPAIPPTAWQMLPRTGNRKILSLNNMGPSDLLFSSQWFDPGSILQQVSDPANPSTVLPAPLQMVRIGILKSGANVTMNTTSLIYVYNVSPTGALVSIQEDVFVVPNRQPAEPGSDGRAFQGYAQIPDADEGDVQSAKALR